MTGPFDGNLDDPPPYILLLSDDSVVVLASHVDVGAAFAGPDGSHWTICQALDTGTKLAAHAIQAGESVIKFGMPIGTATRAISAGELVHTHNLRSNFMPIEHEGVEHGERSAD